MAHRLYNRAMEDDFEWPDDEPWHTEEEECMERLKNKMEILTREMESLIQEQGQLRNRSKAIEVRMNQIMGGLQALQEVLHDETISQAAQKVAQAVEQLDPQKQ